MCIYIRIYHIYVCQKLSTAHRTKEVLRQRAAARDVRRVVRPSGRRIASHPLKACARSARRVRAVRGPAGGSKRRFQIP